MLKSALAACASLCLALPASAQSPANFLATYDVTLEIEGSARPALTARWLSMIVL